MVQIQAMGYDIINIESVIEIDVDIKSFIEQNMQRIKALCKDIHAEHRLECKTRSILGVQIQGRISAKVEIRAVKQKHERFLETIRQWMVDEQEAKATQQNKTDQIIDQLRKEYAARAKEVEFIASLLADKDEILGADILLPQTGYLGRVQMTKETWITLLETYLEKYGK